MGNKIIETFDLTKKYKLKDHRKELIALNKVNISIEEGEIFGLLGPNGAGKTTLIQILTTINQPTSGYATVDGYNILKTPKKAKSAVALMLDSTMLYNRLTALNNLRFFCRIYKVPNYEKKIQNIAEQFGLEKWLNQYVENFSSGMKMKLALCRTLLLERKILFLDEPTLGLDVKSISFIVDQLKKSKKTIFLTSHDMSVVEKLCDRISFIHNCNIIRIGNKNDIKELLQAEIIVEIEVIDNKDQLKSEINQQEFANEIIDINENLVIKLKSRKYYKDLCLILSQYNILKIKEHELSLEDLFLKIINN